MQGAGLWRLTASPNTAPPAGTTDTHWQLSPLCITIHLNTNTNTNTNTMRDNNSQIQTLLLIIWRRHNILFESSLANCNWDDRFKTCGTETDFICVFVYLCICVFAFVCLWFQRILLYKYRANVVCARGRDGSFKTSGIFEHRLSDNSAKSELTHLFVNASLLSLKQHFLPKFWKL